MTTTRSTEEYFHLLFHTYDIRAAEALIAAKAEPAAKRLNVAQTARKFCLDRTPAQLREDGTIPLVGRVDEEWALAHADTSRPVIIADTSNSYLDLPPEHMLIDGFHRLRRAFVDGLEFLPAYVLTAQESWDIRVDSEKRRRRTRAKKNP